MNKSEGGPILITGAAGFVGRYLAEALQQRWPNRQLILADRVSVSSLQGRILELDIGDSDAVTDLFRHFQPSVVVHLAAIAAVTSSFSDPRVAWAVNTIGTLNVILTIQAEVPDCHMLLVSSAEVYGRSSFSGTPVSETTLLLPANPYAATKAAADIMVQEAAGRGLRATIVRPFNHTGPGQADLFAIPTFCSQIARIEKGQQPPVIKVGELRDERDLMDVSDVVDMYVQIITQVDTIQNGLVLNAASGRVRRIGGILEHLLSLTSKEISIEVDPSRLRATRVPRVVGDASLALQHLGWKASTPIEDTLSRTLDFWRRVT